MSSSKLIHLSYFDPRSQVRLTVYADTLVTDMASSTLCAVRFGGYPEMVRAMSDAIYAGASIEAQSANGSKILQCKPKSCRRELAHDGIYATATIMAADDAQFSDSAQECDGQETMQPRKCYLFCPAGDRTRLFEELDRKTCVPLIPEFQDYVLSELLSRRHLRKLSVFSLKEKLDAYVLELEQDDQNVAAVLEDGFRTGKVVIPGAAAGADDGFAEVNSVTDYLNTFGVTVADRIRSQFEPLFDPASEPLSPEGLAINGYVREKAGYSLYNAQLAVAEAVKRRLLRNKVAVICAECGSGKTKLGAVALGAAQSGQRKTFNLVLCPSHITKKWVREIVETLPETYGVVVRNITELNCLYAAYTQGDKSVYAVFSKERARDGYMRYPAVLWNRRKGAFLCPDCMEPIQTSDDIDDSDLADQFFFQKEHSRNHKCPNCGSVIWAPVNPGRKIAWVKLGGYGWVYGERAADHLFKTKNAKTLDQLQAIVENPNGHFPTAGACRRYPLSTYIKKKMRGKIHGCLCDELHEYNNASGQGDAMAELYGTCRKFIGMTATLINGYSSGIFHLLYRIAPGLMRKDGKDYRRPKDFDSEYGVVETTYEVEDANYNSNRRTVKRQVKTRQLPGVSPLVFSRFLLECTAFLSLSDMGKELPDYEEIPVPLKMPEDVKEAYDDAENKLTRILRQDRRIAQKILSSYLGLLTVYPDQPYDQPSILHPMTGTALVTPEDRGDFDRLLPKEKDILELVRDKVAAGQRVLLYTSWTRTDSQQKLLKLLRAEGYRTDLLTPKIAPDKREEWVEKRVKAGIQVLITNPKCVETGLDLNAFTTLIFYSMGYNLFTLRQASRRSWRINQTAPRVEVYLFYYQGTMQAKAMKLMASKLAVAGIIEGTFSEEGLAAMSDVKDMTSQMAKELTLGIKDSVEDIAAAFKRMAILNPERKQSVEAVEKPALPEAMPVPMVRHPVFSQAEIEELLHTAKNKRTSKAKKVEADDGQLSFLDLVA